MPEPQPHPPGELADDSEEAPRIEPAGLADERFATNIRETRERLKMSQGELARQMAERNFPYYQQTVRRIEEGRRKVSVGEAKALADILGTTMDRLTWPGRAESAAGFLDSVIARVLNSWDQVGAWTSGLLSAQHQLRVSIGEAERADYYGSPKIREIVQEGRDALEMTPEAALEDGRKHHEQLRETGAQMLAEATGQGEQDHADLRGQDDEEAEDLLPPPHPEESAG